MKLFDYQQEIINSYPSKLGCWFKPGLGKSAIAVSIAKKINKRFIVVCPKPLLENWEREIKTWWSEATNYTVISKENFTKKHAVISSDFTIIDESHLAFHSYKTKMYKAMQTFLETEKCQLLMMTGTPLTATYWSVYSFIKLMGFNINYIKFRNAFFYPRKIGMRTIWVEREDQHTKDRISELIKKYGYTLSMEDVFEVPKQEYIYEYFDINSEQKNLYITLADPNPAVNHTRRHQIESGCIKSDGYREEIIIDCEKTNRVLQLCADNDKIIVVARYNLQLEHYYKKLKEIFPAREIDIINGSVLDRDDIITRQNNCEKGILLINAACSAGYNLPKIPVMVFASMDYGYVNFEQMHARIQRANNLKTNTYYYLLTRGDSTDKKVIKSMQLGQDFNASIYEQVGGKKNK